jgi:hypothetical protein
MRFFEPNAGWSQVAPHIKVVGLSIAVLTRTSEAELMRIFGDLQERNVAISLDMLPLPGGPNTCGHQVEGYSAPGQTITIAKHVKYLGAMPESYSMDEPLYFGHFYSRQNACHSELPTLIQQVAQRVKEVRSVFPNVRIGETEPIMAVTQGGLAELEQWLDLYEQATGEPLSFMTLDMDWDAQWRPRISAVVDLLRSKRVAVQIIYNGSGRATSDEEWTDQAVGRFLAFEAIRKPDVATFTSWNPHPTHLLPESDSRTLTGLVYRYIHSN